MNRLLHDIKRLTLAVVLPLLMAMTPVMAQTIVYVGDTSPLVVVPVPGNTYQWELYSNGTIDFATSPGNCPVTSAAFVAGNTGPSVSVKWLKTGTYFFKVIARDGANCTNNLKTGIVMVKSAIPTAVITPPNPICIGETPLLSIALTGTAPWTITYTDGVQAWTVTAITNTPYQLTVSPKTTTNYWITQVIDQDGTNTIPSVSVVLQVNPKPAGSKIYLYQP